MLKLLTGLGGLVAAIVGYGGALSLLIVLFGVLFGSLIGDEAAQLTVTMGLFPALLMLDLIGMSVIQLDLWERFGELGTGDIITMFQSIPDEAKLNATLAQLGTFFLAIAMTVVSKRLDRAAVNAAVVERLREANADYIENILGVQGFSEQGMGRSTTGTEYTQDVLALESSGGHGDAKYTARAAPELGTSSHHKSRFTRWAVKMLPMISGYTRVTGPGTKQLMMRVAVFVISMGITTAACSSILGLWGMTNSDALGMLVSLLANAAVCALIWLPGRAWEGLIVQPASSASHTVFYLAFGIVAAMLGNGVLSMLTGTSQGVSFFFAFVALLPLIAVSQSVVFEARMNGVADSKLAEFFRTLIDQKVHGTHSFAACKSCATPTILLLGQAKPCDSCRRVVDRSMNVRTVDV